MTNPTPHISKPFTRHWTANIPSHLVLRHAAPSIPIRLVIIRNPANWIHISSQPALWDDASDATWTTAQQARFDLSIRVFDNLDVLVEVRGEVIGLSAISTLEGELKNGQRLLNAGVILEKVARGNGVGKAVTGMMVEIALMIRGEMGVRTMKANMGMRGAMKKLRVEEEVEGVMMEGWGSVAEIVYVIEKEKWESLVVCLDFGEEM